MPSFQYKALQADGTIAEGEIEAGGRQEAFRGMEARGLRPIRLAEAKPVNGQAPPRKALRSGWHDRRGRDRSRRAPGSLSRDGGSRSPSHSSGRSEARQWPGTSEESAPIWMARSPRARSKPAGARKPFAGWRLEVSVPFVWQKRSPSMARHLRGKR